MSSLRQRSNMERIAKTEAAKAWAKDDNWKNIKGGFNPDVFKNLDETTRQRLLDNQIGPPVIMGDKMDVSKAFSVGHWNDNRTTGLYHPAGGLMDTIKRSQDKKGNAHIVNRGSVQDAVWEMGLSNIQNSDQLNQFLDRTDALKATHGNFLEDGWDPKDIMLFREQPAQEVVQESAPVVADPVEVTETPEIVEEVPVVKEPVEGVDYMSSDMQDAYDRIQGYNSGFSAQNWIADKSRPDEKSQAQAQELADQYKFKIKQDLKPTEESTLNALTTAIPNSLGVFSGYSA